MSSSADERRWTQMNADGRGKRRSWFDRRLSVVAPFMSFMLFMVKMFVSTMKDMKSMKVQRRRAFTILEILLAISILAIGLISIVTLFPVAIYTQRQMIDETRSAIVARDAMDILRANRVAEYLSTLGVADASWVPLDYPGDSEAATNSLYEDAAAAYAPIFRDIDGQYPAVAPAGWQYVWTAWDEVGRDAANAIPARPDANPGDGVADRVFANYSWTALIYAQNTVPVPNAGNLYRYRVELAVFRGYDATGIDVSGAAAVAGNDPSNNKGYIEAEDAAFADVLRAGRGYVRIVPPAVPALAAENRLWYRVESVVRNVGPGRDRTRLVLAVPWRSSTNVPFIPATVLVSDNLVHLADCVLVAQP
ncbi:MAG: type II secretion system protein [Planctomycetota bacterium]